MTRPVYIGLAAALLWAAMSVGSGCDRSSAPPAALPPVAAAASVAPLAALVRAVGDGRVAAAAFAAGPRRATDYGDRDPSRLPYRPDPADQAPLRDSAFLAVDGRADPWALAGLSQELAGAPQGPVLRLDALPAARALDAAGVRGALWLDPLTMAQAARDAAGRLTAIRPDAARPFAAAADRLADRLGGMTAGRTRRWDKVAVVSDEPLPLLSRLGIAWVRVAAEPDRTVASPAKLAAAARAGGASAILLSGDWAGETRDAWQRAVGLPVALYSPLGPSALADAPDPAQALIDWTAANLDGADDAELTSQK